MPRRTHVMIIPVLSLSLSLSLSSLTACGSATVHLAMAVGTAL